jgi:hypothetical protein
LIVNEEGAALASLFQAHDQGPRRKRFGYQLPNIRRFDGSTRRWLS